MPLFDTNVLLRFGAARALVRLTPLQPILITRRVRLEHDRTAPDHARDQFHTGVRERWIRVTRGVHPRAIAAVQDEFDALSDADAELLAVAVREGYALFTDERQLGHACKARGVAVFDVVDTLALLVELETLDLDGLRALVAEMSKERTFAPDDLALLDLRGPP